MMRSYPRQNLLPVIGRRVTSSCENQLARFENLWSRNSPYISEEAIKSPSCYPRLQYPSEPYRFLFFAAASFTKVPAGFSDNHLTEAIYPL